MDWSFEYVLYMYNICIGIQISLLIYCEFEIQVIKIRTIN